ncbi:Holliday junction resolvase RuvX [Holospora curviuscula]|uniref:Putative pre-16S rRNA nuclease n=1 Tax=Holospora curviuscula TaxID=1082868 RepID=A0A2S5R739_9PROT|nr:Holliday junction resolvase RuvX [Holospora curviuscula]PPE03097.1 putative Holliday junction resolvase [Holospora curviuscula]
MHHRIFLEDRASLTFSESCLGIDLGRKFTGISISNPENIIAVPLKVLPTSSYNRLAKNIISILNEYSASWIVLGLPLNLNGSWSKGCSLVVEFAQHLEPYPVCLWDERLSTVSVQHLTLVKTKKIDAQAATVILQHALDRLNNLKIEIKNKKML